MSQFFYIAMQLFLTSLRFQIFTSCCLCWLLSFEKLTSIVTYLVDSVGKKAHILFNIGMYVL